jgi:hypothetical protein
MKIVHNPLHNGESSSHGDDHVRLIHDLLIDSSPGLVARVAKDVCLPLARAVFCPSASQKPH